MKQLQLVSSIYKFDNFQKFAKEFSITENDIILTNEYIYDSVIKKYDIPCSVIFQEKYGNGEPTDIMINGILKEIKQKKYHRMVAVGGGTIMDIAKVLVVADDTEDMNELYDQMDELKAGHELFAVPTTCGTGSEVTNISIVNRTKLGTKQGLVSKEMFAKAAVLIPEFTETLPYEVFATSSIDALIHAIESFLSPNANEYTRLFSRKAMKEIIYGYKQVAVDKNAYKKQAELFLTASNYAGIAFGNAGCGTIHAMSYALSGKYHVAHGAANYVFLGAVLEYYRYRNPHGCICELEEILENCLNVWDGIRGLNELLAAVLPYKSMKDYGAEENDIRVFAEMTIENQQRLLSRSYVPVDVDAVEEIYKKCL